MAFHLTVKELIRRLTAVQDKDQPVEVRVESTVDFMRGQSPTVAITGLDVGFDWDHGTVFLQTSEKIHKVADSDFESIVKTSKKNADLVGRIRNILTDTTAKDHDKMTSLRALLVIQA